MTQSIPIGSGVRAKFAKEVFARSNFVSSLGRGRFDCAYDQEQGVLDVTVKIDIGEGSVPPARRQPLAEHFQERVPAYWNQKWVFRCTRAGWTDLPPVRCRFHVEIVEPEDSHFTLLLSLPQGSSASSTVPVYMRECRGFLSMKQVTTDNPQAKDQLNLLDYHVVDFDHVLAAQLITQYERIRLQEAMGTLWNTFPVPLTVTRKNQQEKITATAVALFMGFDGEINYLLEEKLTLLAKIAAMRVPGTRPVPIIVAPPGLDLVQEHEDWAAESALVVKFLKEQPGGNEIRLGAAIPDLATLTLRIDEELELTEFTDLHYNVGAHEFGHMLGLPDEYENPVAKQGTSADEAAKATVKARYLTLVQRARLQPPLFPSRTSSMMSYGMTVLPCHAVTVWDALCAMTGPYLAPKDWEILPAT